MDEGIIRQKSIAVKMFENGNIFAFGRKHLVSDRYFGMQERIYTWNFQQNAKRLREDPLSLFIKLVAGAGFEPTTFGL